MKVEIPAELNAYFSEKDFSKYPIIQIPQSFRDDRGSILNLADGQLGDVSFITSTAGAVRANHVHEKDWHLCYLISGVIKYVWKESLSSQVIQQIEVAPGELIFTPPGAPHKMEFPEFSQFVTVSKLSRLSDLYESDILRFSGMNFEP